MIETRLSKCHFLSFFINNFPNNHFWTALSKSCAKQITLSIQNPEILIKVLEETKVKWIPGREGTLRLIHRPCEKTPPIDEILCKVFAGIRSLKKNDDEKFFAARFSETKGIFWKVKLEPSYEKGKIREMEVRMRMMTQSELARRGSSYQIRAGTLFNSSTKSN
ncbi:unnamed protein product, partial [Mesorhabditis belari]|uniref:Uncharacterized protein n=1 Tax=Mesorhabditis belari TaxID=2138241 RepID=A0AAF3J5M6_9BILA